MPTQTFALSEAAAEPMLALSQELEETANLLLLEGEFIRFISSGEAPTMSGSPRAPARSFRRTRPPAAKFY
jgi:DNA-binding IclR family transcriptional regulator